jgi:hypothetical protein
MIDFLVHKTKISELTSQGNTHASAISVCLFQSPKWDTSKHLSPLESVFTSGLGNYDLLIFIEKGMNILPSLLPKWVRVFVVEQTGMKDEPFSPHLWRYYGAKLYSYYRWIWFRGTDTPIIPTRERNLEKVADMLGLETILFPSWSTPFYCCTGRFAVAGSAARVLAENLDELRPIKSHWHCDEETLSRWHRMQNFRTLLAIDKAVASEPLQDYVRERLGIGNHTVIIKDRDDSAQG